MCFQCGAVFAYYGVEGGCGNSGVIVGATGVIVIDTKTTPGTGKQLFDSIAGITPKPVTTAILTHSDLDQVNGLAASPPGSQSSPTRE